MMWTVLLPFLRSYWQYLLIALLCGAVAIQQARVVSAKQARDEARAQIEVMRQLAKQYDTESKTTAKETSDAFSQLVAQIKTKDIAIANARKRFAPCPAVGGTGPDWVLHAPSGDGQAHVPESTGGSQESERLVVDRAFVEGCAADSAFVRAVTDWRMKNNLPVGDH